MHISRRGGSLLVLAAGALTLSACGGHHRSAPSAPPSGSAAPKVAVPHLAGVRIPIAERRLRGAGLVERPYYAGTVGSPRIRTSCYVVLSQGPAPGTRVPKGSPVGIAVGVCPSAMTKEHRG